MRLVLDANVVLKWVNPDEEPGRTEAIGLQDRFLRNEIEIVVPRLLLLEVVNVVGRSWRQPELDQVRLAMALETMPWTVRDPDLPSVARWVVRGLTAYDATYVALAESLSCTVVTADERMLAVAPGVAVAL